RLIEQTADGQSDAEQIAHMRFELRLGEVLGQALTEPYAGRLVYLHGSRHDRQVLAERTARPIELLVALEDQIARLLVRWRASPRRLIWSVPDLEELSQQVAYRLAWIRLYRAMGLVDGTDQHRRRKARLLREALVVGEKFAADENLTGVGHQAMLLAGRAARELAQLTDQEDRKLSFHLKASEHLAAAGAGHAPPAVRAEAKFEAARNLIEQDRYDAAGEAVEAFKLFYVRAFPHDAPAAHVKGALLVSYLYRRRAAAGPGGPAEAAEFDRLAQEALIRPAQDHRQIRDDYLRMIGPIYTDRDDLANLDSMILLAVAETGDASDRAEAALRAILDRSDDTSRSLRTDALWRLGVVLGSAGKPRRAAQRFYELAAGWPDHPRSFDAALNAVREYAAVIDKLTDSGAPVSAELRERMIAALDLLLGRRDWATRDEAARWYYELGYQCHQMAEQPAPAHARCQWIGRAIAAFANVPPSLPAHTEAGYWSLRLRFERLGQFGVAAAEAPQQLLADTNCYSAEALTAAAQEGDPDRAAQLRRWGCSADFLAAVITCQMLNQERAALEMLQALPAKWPGSPALRTAAQFRIRKLLGLRRTAQAIEEIRVARATWGAAGDDLLKLLVVQIRDRLADSLGAARADLEQFRRAYLSFAGDLFAPVAAKPIEARYLLTQMLADANYHAARTDEAAGRGEIARSRYQEALKLFAQCKTYDDARNSAGSGPGRTSRAAVDPANILGLGRACAALGRFDAAIGYYGQLTEGIDRTA
ncbi:MAG: hypothetical protein KAX78_00820, partial [Phycisphaerae bacterium]|nr:hypothetical protein [Phycisphaerae bacterium]